MTDKLHVPARAVATIAAAVAAAWPLLFATPVAADETAVAEPADTIVVQAPIVRRIPAGPPLSGGTQSEIIELSRTVNFADLDLSKEADVAELAQRIESVAADNCEKLSRMFRSADADHRDLRRCTRQAIEHAHAQLDGLIAAGK